MQAAKRFLIEESGLPNLAKIATRCQDFYALRIEMSRQETSRPSRWEPLPGSGSGNKDAILWMRYWPQAVPEGEMRDRYEAACAKMGQKPYYPPADVQGIMPLKFK